MTNYFEMIFIILRKLKVEIYNVAELINFLKVITFIYFLNNFIILPSLV